MQKKGSYVWERFATVSQINQEKLVEKFDGCAPRSYVDGVG